jgi:tetratricopeptide (TPR) repeat protein
LRAIGLALPLLFLPWLASGYEFKPTEAEWATWPPYCKARYATTRIGKGGGYGGKISQSEIQQWQQLTGAGWLYLHHHCAGLAYLQRAKVEANASDRRFLLNRSVNEYRLALENTPISDPFAAEIMVQLGLTYREARDFPAAYDLFDKAIATHPEKAESYVAKAMTLRDEKRVDAALETLAAGDAATSGKSAEIQHFIATLLMQQRRFEEARGYARRAYELGYPLPGLKDSLARAGYPL